MVPSSPSIGRSLVVVALAIAGATVALPWAAAADTDTPPPEWQADLSAPTAVPLADMTPWTLPSMPPYCTSTQMSAGDVAGCVLPSLSGKPDTRGWPSPAFPETPVGPELPWETVSQGASGPLVVDIQEALTAAGFATIADGQFGSATAASVRSFQTESGLEVTGAVDAATAAALGVKNYAPGTPFPPAGWTWLGWAYNGSAALAPFEAGMTTNRSAFSTVRAGQLRTFPEALALFEGFAREIAAGGYTLRDIGIYAFRCTSNSGRKDCWGLSPASLSNHAFGLAMDINTSANPELTYRSPDGTTSACSVPMRTDMPRWVVQVAERWGLFWGGYGWSGGCQTPTTSKSSVIRDPMHFEFRGTPEQARAIASRAAAGPDALCMEVVDSAGETVERCAPGGLPGAGWRIPVTVSVPDGASAALVNVAITGATGSGYVTVESCAARVDGLRDWSNGNYAPGTTTSNLAVAPLNGSGRFCVYVASPVHVVVDLQGFVSTSGSRVLAPAVSRVLDTRSSGGARSGGSVVQVPAGAPPDAVGALANLAVVAPSAAGYVTADRCSQLAPGVQSRSNLNFARLETVSNLSLVPVADEVFCMVPAVTTDLLADVQGWLVPGSSGWGIDLVAASRLVDTRGCRDAGCGVAVPAGGLVRITAPTGASAVLANLTVTQPAGAGFITAGPCDEVGRTEWSNANFDRAETAANLAVVRVGSDGTFCVRPSTSTHLVVDLAATFSPAATGRLSPVTPERMIDSRSL
jgi:hypothetical protein